MTQRGLSCDVGTVCWHFQKQQFCRVAVPPHAHMEAAPGHVYVQWRRGARYGPAVEQVAAECLTPTLAVSGQTEWPLLPQRTSFYPVVEAGNAGHQGRLVGEVLKNDDVGLYGRVVWGDLDGELTSAQIAQASLVPMCHLRLLGGAAAARLALSPQERERLVQEYAQPCYCQADTEALAALVSPPVQQLFEDDGQIIA